MAHWQFCAELIPARRGDEALQLYASGKNYQVVWDDYSHRAKDLEALIDPMLPRRASWTKTITAWGDETSNDIQLLRPRGRVTAVQLRLNPAANDLTEFAVVIAILTAEFNLSILNFESKQIIADATIADVLSAVERSRGALLLGGQSDSATH